MEHQSEGHCRFCLNPKGQFYCEYDFGSTTYLDGQLMAVREGFLGKDRLRILARNNPYDFACENCEIGARAPFKP